MPYDLFLSYSRRDNQQGRITDLKDRIQADYRAFAGDELTCFFDVDDIHGMDDWRHRILAGLRESSLLLLVLSPGYLASPYCEWEIVEYLKYEHSRAAGGQGIAPIYFVEVPGLDAPEFEQRAAAWVNRVSRRNRVDLRPWYDEGADCLKRRDVRTRLEDMERSLHARISKLRRIEQAPGNVPAHNPYFVGREEEMRRLHESTGLGKFGVLTAVQGMGGLGKTALAVQYAYAYADHFPGGRWLIGCAGKTSLAAAVRSLDVDLGVALTDEEKRDDERAAKRILVELESRARAGAEARAGEPAPPAPGALLLLDNVDCPEIVQPPQTDLLSGRRWLHVVATTRLGADEFGYDPLRQTLLAVDELPLDDAVRLIESHQPDGRFTSDAEREAAHALAAILGGFTLAVEVAAVYLGERRGQISCAAFLDRLRREGFVGLEAAAKSTKRSLSHREKLIGATLGPTLDALSTEENLALGYAALLPPDSIPIPWLRTLLTRDHPDLGVEAEPGYDDPWLSLVNHLIDLRLFQVVEIDPAARSPRLVRMHRLVQQLAAARMGEVVGERQAALVALAFERSEDLRKHWHEPPHQWEISPLVAYSDLLLDSGNSEANRLVLAMDGWLARCYPSSLMEIRIRRVLSRLEADPNATPEDLGAAVGNLAGFIQDQARYA
jgi:hypothetical protein